MVQLFELVFDTARLEVEAGQAATLGLSVISHMKLGHAMHYNSGLSGVCHMLDLSTIE